MNFKDKNLVSFRKDFIVAGPRNHVISVLNTLTRINANIVWPKEAEEIIRNNKQIVLLCFNSSTVNGPINCVRILTRFWWNCWHNPKITQQPGYPTYNAWKQKDEILAQFRVKDMETLSPE